MIPKIIHQIWLGDDIPEHMSRWMGEWKELYPDFEYKLWTKNDFGENNFTKISKNKPMYMSDWIRANVLYRYGGIYIDADVQPIKEIPCSYFKSKLVLPNVSKYVTSNYFIMSSVNNRFFKNLIDLYNGCKDKKISKKWDAPTIIENTLIKTFGRYSVLNPNDGSYKFDSKEYVLLKPDETLTFNPYSEIHNEEWDMSEETFCIYFWNNYRQSIINNLK